MKYKIILALYFIALIFAVLIAIKPISNICNPYEGCNTVLNSQYAQILGVKTSIWGIIAISIVILILIAQLKNQTPKKQKFIRFLVILGALIAIFLIYLQKFVIQAYCKYCLVADISLILAAIFLIITWKK
jgi:uncharacterized membrane protein